MDKRNSLLWLLFAMPSAAFAATNGTVIIRDVGNTPYARATRSGETKDWERFRYWAEMIPEEERDSRIRDWLSQLEKKNQPPKTEEKIPLIRKSYVGPVKEYVVKNGDTFGGIAYGHGINIALFKEINDDRKDNLRVGQKFLVPANVESKCQVRVSIYTSKEDGNDDGGKKYMTVDLVSKLSDGITKYKYYRGDGVFDVLLCSDVSSDAIFHFHVSCRDVTPLKSVFVQFQEGLKDMEVEVE